jgi:hypothetical protein
LSPQSRHGRAGQPSHRKPGSRVPSDTARKPAPTPPASDTPDVLTAAAAGADTAADSAASVESASPATKTRDKARTSDRHSAPVRSKSGLNRVRRSSGLRKVYSYFSAYIPVFVAFIAVFAAFWAFTSFGPHPSTPQENWSRIENKWMADRENARAKVSESIIDFKGLIDGYKAFRDADRGWMKELSAISDWTDSKKTAAENAEIAQAMEDFIYAGNAQADLLDQVVTAPSSALLTERYGQAVIESEQTFNTTFSNVRYLLMGSATYTITEGPSLVLPSAAPTSSGSPLPSPTPVPSATTVPSILPSPSPSAKA